MQSACAVLCCHLWPVGPYYILPYSLINSTNFGRKKNYGTQNVCFDLPYNFFSEIFLILRRIQ